MGNSDLTREVISVLKALGERAPDSHKGDYGTILVVSGSRSARGCACLCSYSAIRSGVGKVILASYPEVISACSVLVPEAVFEEVPNLKEVPDRIDFSRLTSVGIGPGIGLSWEVKEGLEYILSSAQSRRLKVVLDADALRLLKGQEFMFAGTVITPHMGEFSNLVDVSVEEIKKDRRGYALEYAKRWNCTVVLKGANTVVADPQGRVFVNPTGNPGMATAGAGDVLLGIVSAFVSLIPDPFLAVSAGVYLHGMAGDLARETKTVVSLIARDIVEAIPEAFRRLLD